MKNHTHLPAVLSRLPIFLGVSVLLVAGCSRDGQSVSTYEEVNVRTSEPPAPQHVARAEGSSTAGPGSRQEGSGAEGSGTESAAPEGSGSGMPPGHPPTGDKPEWVVPAGWTEQAGAGMRMAGFTLDAHGDAVNCTVVALRGDAGGLGPNVNRWLDQLKRETLPGDEMESFLATQERFESAGGHRGLLIDLTRDEDAADSESMLVGILNRENQSLFFKMGGPTSVLREQRDALIGLCRSVK